MSELAAAPDMGGADDLNADLNPDLTIYVSRHCEVCRYAYEVAGEIRRRFPHVRVTLVDLETSPQEAPEAVFATPTYLLNGRVWSLGNPSPEKIQTAFQALHR